MARPVQVYLRALRSAERRLLQAKLKDKKLSARIYGRYRVIAEASRGRPVSEIADRVGVHLTTVYDWVYRFNRTGFAGFEDAPNPQGRPSSLSSRQVRRLIATALARPADLGLPFTHWSVAKLRDFCHQKKLLPALSNEWVRRLLRREGISFQRTKTWKESPDPDFESKKTAF
ncbi:MAG: helix-turn-helix domain-containing protein [candidate division Zixibacteria bacterium]|nr:helix-turn-helix domain-containing protein [candidate division Zixibacteria bacterium]